MANGLVERGSLQDIADAIRYKNGKTTTYKPAEMGPAIRAISGATGTATANEVLTGYTFSNDTGSGLNGSMPKRSASSQTISAGGSASYSYGYYPSGWTVYAGAPYIIAVASGQSIGTTYTELAITFDPNYFTQSGGTASQITALKSITANIQVQNYTQRNSSGTVINAQFRVLKNGSAVYTSASGTYQSYTGSISLSAGDTLAIQHKLASGSASAITRAHLTL